MRVIFAGTPEVALAPFEAVLASRHDVVAVVTRPDAPVGRGRSMKASPVAERAAAEGLEVLKPVKPSDPDFLERLRELAPDCAPIVAYGGLITQAGLDIPAHGWVNLHFSLLPAWRGAAPVQHAVIAGDDITGACTFQLERGMDTGPVFGQVTEEIGPHDTAGDLLGRLSESGAGLLVATLDGIEDGRLRPVPQAADGVSLAPKISVDDARVRWDHPAMAVDRRIRGCTPAPGAWSMFRGERVKLDPVRLAPLGSGPEGLAPGEILVRKNDVFVGTATHAVLLSGVKAEGKKLMAAGDWARGVRPESGEVLA